MSATKTSAETRLIAQRTDLAHTENPSELCAAAWSVMRALLQDAEVIAPNRLGRSRPNLWASKQAT